MGTFQRNAIISGYINSYCLVCECFFEREEQTFSHIKGEDHGKTLLAYPYLEKYGNNGIRKVKAGYFCEYCSQLMATGAKVNLHIAEKLHYYNKGNMLLKQAGSAFTAFDDVLITENAWHSFHEDECWLCNSEFDDQTEHMAERSHVLKLLQNQVQFGNDNSVYRKIDKNYFQCLTCITKLPLSEIEDHFGGDEHNQRYVLCQEVKKKHDLANPIPKAKPKEKTELSEEVKIAVSQDNVVNNKETITGIAGTTREANKEAPNTNSTQEKPAEAKLKEINNKIKKEPKTPKFIIKKDSSDPVIYAKDNQLIYDAKYQNTYCRTCQNKFPSSLRAMKEHVKGKEHINKLAKVTPKPSSEAPKHMKLFRCPMEEFIKNVHSFHTHLYNDTVLNEKFCVPENSCHFFTNKFGEYTCQICQMNLLEEDMEDHCKTVKHEKGMRETPIITNPKVKDEFIREVRPETFHCGFCNVVIPGWDATEAHIKTTDHKSNVTTCNRRLQNHLLAIRAQINDERMKAALFDMFVNRMRN